MSINEKILTENMKEEIAKDLLHEDFNQYDQILGLKESDGEEDLTDEEFEAEYERLEQEEDSIECEEDEECEGDLNDYLEDIVDDEDEDDIELDDSSEDNEGDDDIANIDIYGEGSHAMFYESEDEEDDDDEECDKDEEESDEEDEEKEEEVAKESAWFN